MLKSRSNLTCTMLLTTWDFNAYTHGVCIMDDRADPTIFNFVAAMAA
jgi:hypothetical protein